MVKRRKSRSKNKGGGCSVIVGIVVVIIVSFAFFGKDKQSTTRQPSNEDKSQKVSKAPPKPPRKFSEAQKKAFWLELVKVWQDIPSTDTQQINEATKAFQKRHNLTDEELKVIKRAGLENDWQLPTPKPTVTPYPKPTVTPYPTPKPKQPVHKYSCSPKKNCGQMSSCAEAQYHLNTCGNKSLDRDKDGIPCESLCGG